MSNSLLKKDITNRGETPRGRQEELREQLKQLHHKEHLQQCKVQLTQLEQEIAWRENLSVGQLKDEIKNRGGTPKANSLKALQKQLEELQRQKSGSSILVARGETGRLRLHQGPRGSSQKRQSRRRQTGKQQRRRQTRKQQRRWQTGKQQSGQPGEQHRRGQTGKQQRR